MSGARGRRSRRSAPLAPLPGPNELFRGHVRHPAVTPTGQHKVTGAGDVAAATNTARPHRSHQLGALARPTRAVDAQTAHARNAKCGPACDPLAERGPRKTWPGQCQQLNQQDVALLGYDRRCLLVDGVPVAWPWDGRRPLLLYLPRRAVDKYRAPHTAFARHFDVPVHCALKACYVPGVLHALRAAGGGLDAGPSGQHGAQDALGVQEGPGADGPGPELDGGRASAPSVPCPFRAAGMVTAGRPFSASTTTASSSLRDSGAVLAGLRKMP